MNTKKPVSVFSLVYKYFLEGLLVLLPLTITIAVVVWLVTFFRNQVGPQTVVGGFLKSMGIRIAGDSLMSYAVGLGMVLGAILVLGFVVDIGAKKYIKSIIDSVMRRIPLINKLYKVSAQIVGMINKSEQEDFKGMKVVYCTFGTNAGVTFLALMPTSQTYLLNGEEHNVVMVPTAPVPMGGGLLLVPKSSVQPAEMSIEDFMQIYFSMGAASENILPVYDPSLAK